MSKRLAIIIITAWTAQASAQPATPAPAAPAPTPAPAPAQTTDAETPAQAPPTVAAPAAPPAPVAVVPASPWGSSPYVVAYSPPPVTSSASRAHRGLTLEVAAAVGTTSRDESAGGASLAIGLWVTREVALTFRATDTGTIGIVAASAQYYATERAWFGGGVGSLSEEVMVDEFGSTERIRGPGGFLRAGYNIGQSGRHALTLFGELQMGAIEGINRVVGLGSIGYQLL